MKLQRQRVDLETAASIPLFEAVFHSAGVGMAIVDSRGRFVRTNPHWRTIFGYAEDEVVGREFTLVIPEGQHDRAWALLRQHLDGEGDAALIEREIVTKAGERRIGRLTNGRFTTPSGAPFVVSTVRDVTELKRQEEALALQSMLLRSSVDSMQHGLCVFDSELRLVLWNDLYFTLMGYPRALEKSGTPYEAFIRHNAVTGEYGPGDPDAQVAARLNPQHLSRSSVNEWRRKNGRVLEFRRNPMPGGGLIATMTDITEQRLAEAALRDSEALKSATIAAALDPIIVADETGAIIEFNPAAERTFGYAREAVIGRPMVETIVPPQLRARHLEGMARFLAGGERRLIGRRVEIEAMRADGALFPVEVTVTDVTMAGRKIFTAYLRDLTQKRQAEAEIARQREALHQSEKLSALGSLLAGVAHELNNPLSVVVGQSMMMDQTAGEPRAKARAAKIRLAAERCVRIVKSFLAMARQSTPQRGPVQINGVINATLDLLDYALRSSGIEVTTALAARIPPLWADGGQLSQVLSNLMINAQQAVSDQPQPRRLHVATAYDSSLRTIRVEVTDNGPGVPAEIRARIFEPFFTTKPEGAGTGIGLSVCHGIVEGHGGSIMVEAPAAGGTRFVVTLPLIEPANDGPLSTFDEPRLVEGGTVLVVDDEPDLAEMLGEILSFAGYETDISTSGLDALDRLAQRDYDLILSDLRMPDLDGPSLYKALQIKKPHLVDRIVFVTGDTLSASVSTFLGQCGRPCIEKPFSPEEVRRVVGRVLAAAAARERPAPYAK